MRKRCRWAAWLLSLGRAEIELESGEPGVTRNPDGSYTLTVPKGEGLHLDMSVTEDGSLTVDRLTVSSAEKPDPGTGSQTGNSPKTGDDSMLILWGILGLASAGALLGLKKAKSCEDVRSKKKKSR